MKVEAPDLNQGWDHQQIGFYLTRHQTDSLEVAIKREMAAGNKYVITPNPNHPPSVMYTNSAETALMWSQGKLGKQKEVDR